MEQQKTIDLIIEALEAKGVLVGCHKIQKGRGVQIKLFDNTYFTIVMAEQKEGDGIHLYCENK